MILSKQQIKKAVEVGEIKITPFNEELLKPASYTFTLGNKIRKLKEVGFEEFEIGQEGCLLKPGEFVICHTAETLKLGENVACFLSMKGALAQKGLDALQCEIFCEPGSEGGFDGKLMLETSNRGPFPITLFSGTKIVKGIFFRV